MKRLLLYIVTMLLVLSSCEREIEYDGEVTKPKLVLQAEVSEGFEPVRVYVSRSHFFLNCLKSLYYENMSNVLQYLLRNVDK